MPNEPNLESTQEPLLLEVKASFGENANREQSQSTWAVAGGNGPPAVHDQGMAMLGGRDSDGEGSRRPTPESGLAATTTPGA